MELRQLNYFVTLASTLNFSESANKLFITQGTLSQQIKQLENEIGSDLFIRNSHDVHLTEAGEELLPYAKEVVEASLNCKKRIEDLNNILVGTINIGLTNSFSVLLTQAITEFSIAHPNIKINIFYKPSMPLYQMLQNREIDFMLAYKPAVTHPDVESEQLFSCELAAIMRKNHPLASKESISMSDLQKQRIVLPNNGAQSRRAFDAFVDVDTSNLNVCMELSEPYIILEILQDSNMVSILSTLAIHYNHQLIAKPIDGIKRELQGCIHVLKNNYQKKSVKVFLQMLREKAALGRIKFSGK